MSDVSVVSAAHRQVGFVESVKLFFRNYVNFKDRSSRGAYWWLVLAYLIAAIVLSLIDAMIGFSLLSNLLTLATIIPNIALSVRRLHDIDKSGWWVLIGLIPLVGWIVLIVWACRPGQRAPNRFGEDAEAGR